jgi:hypothetical protein
MDSLCGVTSSSGVSTCSRRHSSLRWCFASVVHSGPQPGTPGFLHANFAAALSAALPVDPELRLGGSLAPLADAALNGRSDPVNAPGALASAPRSFFVLRDGLL